MATKNNPGRFDCYSHARPDEPMFVLLGRDPMAGSRNIPEMLALIHSEVSEALEEYRDKSDERLAVDEYVNGKPIGFPSELADIVIRVADLAGFLKIDLKRAIVEKMEYNATRPHRHGRKRC